jgi:hypothetical protein
MFNLKSVIKTPEIEFLCHSEDFGIIPEPYSARKLMPEWYKSLPPKIEKKELLENSTIKRCAPFLDAMCIGYIIPLAADVEFITNDDASGVTYKSMFYRTMIENHNRNQIETDKIPHPTSPKPPMKFLNWWAIKVPKDYSVLFIPPMNRIDKRFQCMSGMVDCDGYFEFINFPFFFTEPNYTGILKAGTPLVQVIPIKRGSMLTDYSNNKLSEKDLQELDITRKKRASHESHYRDSVWSRK